MKPQKNDGKSSQAVVIPERAEVPDRYKWNPGVIFPSVKAWEREKRALQQAVPKLRQHEGECSRSVARLARCLTQVWALRLRLEYLDAFASRLYDTDVRQSRPQAMSAPIAPQLPPKGVVAVGRKSRSAPSTRHRAVAP